MPRRSPYNPLLRTYPDSRKVNAVPEAAEVLYVRLIAAADDTGRYWGEPWQVLGKLFTERATNGEVDVHDIAARLVALERVGLIERYVTGGETYLQLVHVIRTLRADRPVLSEFPGPDGAERDPMGSNGNDGEAKGPNDGTRPPQTQTQGTDPDPDPDPERAAAEASCNRGRSSSIPAARTPARRKSKAGRKTRGGGSSKKRAKT